MLVRARCNRRSCQARKTYPKPLAAYVKWPLCPACRIGKMYEDRHRTSGKEHKQRRLCMCDGYPASQKNGPHQWGSPLCKGREEYLLELAFTRGTKTHSPKTSNATDDPGF